MNKITEDGMVTCCRCNGKKWIHKYSSIRSTIKVNVCGFTLYKPSCPKCKGEGIVNWLENVINNDEEDSPCVSSGSFFDWNFFNNHYRYLEPSKTKTPWKHWSDKSKVII